MREVGRAGGWRWIIAAGLAGLAIAAFAAPAWGIVLSWLAGLIGADLAAGPGSALLVVATLLVGLLGAMVLAPATWRARLLAAAVMLLALLALFAWYGLTFSDASPLAS